MMRWLSLWLVACAPAATPIEPAAPLEPAAPAETAPETPSPDRCASAKEGEPCTDGDACVLDWGEPGGHSSALWCRDGRWELELERNLPE